MQDIHMTNTVFNKKNWFPKIVVLWFVLLSAMASYNFYQNMMDSKSFENNQNYLLERRAITDEEHEKLWENLNAVQRKLNLPETKRPDNY